MISWGKAALKGPNAGFQAWEAGCWVDLELLAFFEGSEGESADQAFNIQSGFRIDYGFALLELKSAPPGSSDTYLSPIRPFVLIEAMASS